MQRNTITEAYTLGCKSRNACYPRTANPYAPHQPEHRAWDNGWCAPR